MTGETEATAPPKEVEASPRPPNPEEQESEPPRGVVVEEIGVGSALEKAGLQVGDVVLSWRRLSNPPANPQEARGELRSPFDWMWMEIEQAPRGVVEVSGERNGEPKVFRIEPGRWRISVWPVMPQTVLKAIRGAWDLNEDGAYAPAARALQETAELVRSNGNQSLHTWILLKAAQVWAKEMGRAKSAETREAAREAIEKALASAQEPVAQAVLWSELAKHWVARGNFDQAGACRRAEIRTWQQIGGNQSLGLARSRYGFAGLLMFLKGRHRAEELLYQALHTQEGFIPESLPTADTLSLLGRVLMDQGDLDLAQGYVERAVAIQQKLDPEGPGLAASLNHLGMLADSRGDWKLGERYHRRALAFSQKRAPGSFGVAANLNNLGASLHGAGDRDAAEKHFGQALAILEELVPGSILHSVVLSNLGTLAHEKHLEELSSEYFQRALEIRERLLPGSLYLSYSLTQLGSVALERGDFEEANENYRRALEIREKLAPGSLKEAYSLNNLGMVARAQGKSNLATQFFARATETLESQIGRLGGSHHLKANFLADRNGFYSDLIQALLELDHRQEAFQTLERSRAQSFLALLAERHLLFEADLPEELAGRRERFLVRHDRAYQELMESAQATPEERETLQGRLADIQRELDEIREDIRRTSPRFAALQYPQPLNLEGARRALDPGTVLLSYSVGEEQVILFVVRPEGGLTVKTFPLGEEELRNQVTLMRNLIAEGRPGSEVGSFRGDELQRVSRRLYDALIAPVAEELEEAERLLILPDSALHILPWAALVRDIPETESTVGNQGEEGRDWQYLIEWKPVHIALSATVYAELRETRQRGPEERGPPVLQAAFGDPQIPDRFRRDDVDAIEDVRVRSAAERGFDFRPLPATRLEVEGIAQLFGSAARAYLGSEATEERAKSVGAEARYLHFATHGHLDERFPLNSALVLSIPETFHEDRDNGLLQVWEIFERVRLDADLVVLSACESALGEELGGEGLIGLTRAFQYVGARSVVASLWQVADASTAELMLRFYRHLQAGQTKDEALRAAQLELIRGPILVGPEGAREETDASAPHAWAAFQLYGDWR